MPCSVSHFASITGEFQANPRRVRRSYTSVTKREENVQAERIAERFRRRACDPLAAAAVAGVAAGVVSTVAQLVLWALFTDALPEILFRDARLAAAIVLGREVLAPQAEGSGLRVMAVATAVHFALSIAYGFAIAALVRRGGMGAALLVGAWFGAALFVVNMYGFTLVFPWFDVARDPITFAAHVVFGVSGATVYKALRAPAA